MPKEKMLSQAKMVRMLRKVVMLTNMLGVIGATMEATKKIKVRYGTGQELTDTGAKMAKKEETLMAGVVLKVDGTENTETRGLTE